MHLKPEGGPSNIGFMKCVTCVQFHFKSPWGSRGDCKTMQKSCVPNHEKNNEHKTTIAKWEIAHFSSLTWFLCLNMFNILLKKNIPKSLFA
jgi:hypothetical protein